MTAALVGRESLEMQLLALPPVRDGYRRVYRGQTQRYPTLLASGNRGTPNKRNLAWLLHAHLMARRMLNSANAKPEDGYASLNDFLFWFEAIKQHYGPGSPFIDVTHSLDVALWFASHQSEWIRTSNTIGVGQTVGVDVFPVVRRWLGYRRATQSGWIYVLDVPLASKGPTYEHGSFVDLRVDAPAVFGTSARIQAQLACLVFGRKEDSGGDLSSFLACEPIEIAPSVSVDIPGAGDVPAVFPSADDDPWYARFLDTPHAWDLDGDERMRSFLAPALDITLYAPSVTPTDAELRQLRSRFYVVPQPLLLNYFLQVGGGAAEMANAVGVVLEGPITIGTPPLETDNWHEEALWRGIPLEAPVHNPKTGEVEGIIALDSVFFEFNPLERADWDRFDGPEPFEMVRGVWLKRVADGFEVLLALQTAGEDPGLMGGFVVILDERTKRISIRNGEESESRLELRTITTFAKPIFHALLALHHLGVNETIAPLPFITTESQILAMQQGAVARLEVAALPCQGAGYLRIRNATNGALYLGGGRSLVEREATLDSDQPFGTLSYEQIASAFTTPVSTAH